MTWAKNGNLGRFTNFVNLMDMAAIAVPSGVLRCQPICTASPGNSLSGQYGMMGYLLDEFPGMDGVTFWCGVCPNECISQMSQTPMGMEDFY